MYFQGDEFDGRKGSRPELFVLLPFQKIQVGIIQVGLLQILI